MMKKVKWTCSKFKNIENRVALFGDFRSENRTFGSKSKIKAIFTIDSDAGHSICKAPL